MTLAGWRCSSRRASPAKRRPHVPEAQVGVDRARGERRPVGREGEAPAPPPRGGAARAPRARGPRPRGARSRPRGRRPGALPSGEKARQRAQRVVARALVELGAQGRDLGARVEVPEPDGSVPARHREDVPHRGEATAWVAGGSPKVASSRKTEAPARAQVGEGGGAEVRGNGRGRGAGHGERGRELGGTPPAVGSSGAAKGEGGRAGRAAAPRSRSCSSMAVTRA